MIDRYPWELTPLERATGIVIGRDPSAPTLPPAPQDASPRAALVAAIARGLERPPCFVLFSGGRDSSAVLALAARYAGERGLPPPNAVTFRYPASAQADERRWQEAAVEGLSIGEWIRIELTDEMDCLGPIGVATLRRHRLLFPFGVHSLVPALELAAGGSLLTGIGGDEILGRRTRLADVVARRAGPRPRDAARVALALAPGWARRRRARGRAPAFVDWLTPLGRERFEESWGRFVADESWHWGRGLERIWASRDLQVAVAAMDVVAADAGACLVHPFLDPGFVAALARDGGSRGYAGRTELLRALCGDALPAAVIARTSKAVFSGPYWARYSQDFAREWTGDGVDPSLVDVETLKAHWSGVEPPPAPTLVLLKQAWLATAGQSDDSSSTSSSAAASSRDQARGRRSSNPGSAESASS